MVFQTISANALSVQKLDRSWPISVYNSLAAIFNCVTSLLPFAPSLLCRPDGKLARHQICGLHPYEGLSRGKSELMHRPQNTVISQTYEILFITTTMIINSSK